MTALLAVIGATPYVCCFYHVDLRKNWRTSSPRPSKHDNAVAAACHGSVCQVVV